MRSTSKLSVSLAAISLGLVLVFGNSGRTDDPTKGKFSIQILEQQRPAEAAKTKPTLQDLEQKRMELLEQLCDTAKVQFENGRIEYAEVLAANRELLAARIEAAKTKEERIKAYDEAISNADQMHEIAKAMKQRARGTELAVLRTEVFLLETQIGRAKLEAEK